MKEKKEEKEKKKKKGEEKEGDDDDLFQVTCTQLSLCLRYSGTGVADTLEVPPRHHRFPPHDHHCDNDFQTHDHHHRLHPHDPNRHDHHAPPRHHHDHHCHNREHNFPFTRLRLRWSWTLASSSPPVCSSLQGSTLASLSSWSYSSSLSSSWSPSPLSSLSSTSTLEPSFSSS